ncbi:MAG: phosphoribosylanthranilate isomerase [Candidatus Dormibacteria bacterium]
MRIKVCGTTSISGALAAVEAGADALGFIMAPGGPRGLDISSAIEITREMPSTVDLVGVFVDRPLAEVEEVAAEAGFTAIQLHGHERWADFEACSLPVVKVVRLRSAVDAARVDWPLGLPLLVDTHADEMFGGTGRSFPWDWAQDLALGYRLVVSGGLDGDNVGAAVRRLRPFAVDASSRLESSAGIKDPARVRAFVESARRAEEEVFGA